MENSGADNKFKLCLQQGRKFNWDAETQGILHGSFFYGYLVSQVPGGWIAHKYGAKLPFALCMLVQGLLTLLSPLAANAGVWVFFFVRVLIGICQVRTARYTLSDYIPGYGKMCLLRCVCREKATWKLGKKTRPFFQVAQVFEDIG